MGEVLTCDERGENEERRTAGFWACPESAAPSPKTEGLKSLNEFPGTKTSNLRLILLLREVYQQMSDAESGDLQLVKRCKDGDREAYDQLVIKYQDRIFNLICRLTGSLEDSRDLAQEVFIKAYTSIGGFKQNSAFYTWLYRIAVNTVTSYHRSQRAARNPKVLSLNGPRDAANLDSRSIDPGDSSLDPSKILDRRERDRIIQNAIDSLEEDHRAVVILRDIEGHNYDEIAEILDCPTGTVKSRLHRARLQLRDKLAPLLKAE